MHPQQRILATPMHGSAAEGLHGLQQCTRLSQCQQWVTHGWQDWTINSETSMSTPRRSGARYCQIAMRCRTEMTSLTDRCRHIQVCTSQLGRLVRPDVSFVEGGKGRVERKEK